MIDKKGFGKFINRNAWIIAGIYSFLMFLLVYFFSYPGWETSDDYLISGILSGITGKSSPYVLVISYPLSYILHQLQLHIPLVNWLTILELFSVWISFSVFIWVFLKKMTKGDLLVAFLMPLVFETSFFMTLNYTRSACLLMFTGLFLIYYCTLEIFCVKNVVFGGILFVLGVMVRYGCMYLVAPFVGIWIVLSLIRQKRRHIYKKKENCTFIVSAICILVISFGLIFYHKYVYIEFANENNYVEFNSARATAYDYLPKTYEEFENDFKKIGISYNDYMMLKGSMIYDDFFDEIIYRKIADINMGENESLTQKWDAVKKRLWISFSQYGNGRMANQKNTYILFFVVAAIAFVFLNKKDYFSFVCTFCGTILMSFYFIWTGRFPPWIQDSLFLIASITFLYGIQWKESYILLYTQSKKAFIRKWGLCGLSIILVVYCLAFNIRVFEQRTKDFVLDQEVCFALEFMENDEDNVYLIDNFQNCPFPIIDVYGSLRALKRGSWNNILRVGTWFISHPVLEQQLNMLQLKSPIKELVNEDVYLFTNIDSVNLERYQIFISEHYQLETEIYSIWEGDRYAIYKFKALVN